MTDLDERFLTARIRRLSTTCGRLYVQLVRAELEALQLEHLTSVRVELPGGQLVRGVVKTSGATPWLAPGVDSNDQITEVRRSAGFAHGEECRVRVTLE